MRVPFYPTDTCKGTIGLPRVHKRYLLSIFENRGFDKTVLKGGTGWSVQMALDHGNKTVYEVYYFRVSQVPRNSVDFSV